MPEDWANIRDVALSAGAGGRRPIAAAPAALRRTIEVIPSSRNSLFGIACAVVLYGGTLVMFWPFLPEGYRWDVIGFVVCIVAIPLVFPLFLNWRKMIDLDDEGIHTKSRTIAWGSITTIRTARPRSFGVVLVHGELRRKMRLPLSLPLLRELLPELLKRRPELAVPTWISRAMDNPDAALATSRWAIVPLAITGLLLVLIPVLVRYAGSFWVLATPLLANMLLPIPLMLLMGSSGSKEQELLHISHGPTALFLGVLGFTMVVAIPIYVLDAWVALIAAIYFAGALWALLRWKLNACAKAGILVLAIAAPLAIYWPQASEYSPGQDITDLLGTGLHGGGGLLWSRDGNWAIETMTDGEKGETQCAVDMRNFRSVVLPLPKAYQFAWDLDGSCVVRTIGKGGRKTLNLFRIQDGREITLSTAESFGGVRGRCISPAGGLVCWLEAPEANSPRCILKVYDVQADKTQDLAVHWPEGNETAWDGCGWVDDRTIGVRGWSPQWDCTNPSQPRQLHVLKVTYPGAATEGLSSKSGFVNWKVAPDSRQAFASGGGAGGADGNAYYVDLAGGREVMLGGVDLPVWRRDCGAAFRVRNFASEGEWLCRFDPAEAKESRVYRLPEGKKLAALSPRGRFAIVDQERFRLYPMSLVDVKTGREQRLCLPWMSVMYIKDVFGPDIWTPDEERYIVSSYDISRKSPRAILRTVPDDWRGN